MPTSAPANTPASGTPDTLPAHVALLWEPRCTVVVDAGEGEVLQLLTTKKLSVGEALIAIAQLADYLHRRPEFAGQGTQSRYLTTGDPVSVSSKSTQFLRRAITFQAA